MGSRPHSTASSIDGSRTVRTPRSRTFATSSPACSGRCRRVGGCARWPVHWRRHRCTRPAAAGRPVLRSGVRTHGTGAPSCSSGAAQSGGRATDARGIAAHRNHTDRHRGGSHRALGAEARPHVSARDAMKRRRTNVLFFLVLVAGCSLFLAATTKAEAMLYTFVLAFMGLCGYVYLLGQVRQREQIEPPVPVLRPVATERHQPQRQARSRREVSPSAGRRRRPTPFEVPSPGTFASSRRRIGTLGGPRGCSSVGRAQQSHC